MLAIILQNSLQASVLYLPPRWVADVEYTYTISIQVPTHITLVSTPCYADAELRETAPESGSKTNQDSLAWKTLHIKTTLKTPFVLALASRDQKECRQLQCIPLMVKEPYTLHWHSNYFVITNLIQQPLELQNHPAVTWQQKDGRVLVGTCTQAVQLITHYHGIIHINPKNQ